MLSPKKCKSAGERGIYIFTIAHYLWLQACHAKADYIFFNPPPPLSSKYGQSVFEVVLKMFIPR